MSEREGCRKLAEEYWQFLEKWLRMIYVDAFVHGFKHGKEEKGQHE